MCSFRASAAANVLSLVNDHCQRQNGDFFPPCNNSHLTLKIRHKHTLRDMLAVMHTSRGEGINGISVSLQLSEMAPMLNLWTFWCRHLVPNVCCETRVLSLVSLLWLWIMQHNSGGVNFLRWIMINDTSSFHPKVYICFSVIHTRFVWRLKVPHYSRWYIISL